MCISFSSIYKIFPSAIRWPLYHTAQGCFRPRWPALADGLVQAGNMASGHFALDLVCLGERAEWQKGWREMARNGNTMSAGISREMRKAVYKRDGYRCAVCDATEGLQIHHIKPRGKGGANHPMNLVTLCWRCHAAVHGSIMGDEYATAAGCEKGMTPEDVRREVMFYMELEITRYVSDYYAEQGEIWYPWDG